MDCVFVPVGRGSGEATVSTVRICNPYGSVQIPRICPSSIPRYGSVLRDYCVQINTHARQYFQPDGPWPKPDARASRVERKKEKKENKAMTALWLQSDDRTLAVRAFLQTCYGLVSQKRGAGAKSISDSKSLACPHPTRAVDHPSPLSFVIASSFLPMPRAQLNTWVLT
ncbi:hypothetical protein VTK26DRAFT_8222 [Humicola hyalothermophila]